MSEAPASGSWTRAAAAKLNLGLRVVGRRADGFHAIDSLFLRLDLADELSAVVDEGAPGDSLERRPADDPLLDLRPLDLGPSNLVLRAVVAYREAATAVGVALPPLRLSLRKRIPWGAGLGGGSADAAAALRLAEAIAPAGLDLQAIGLRLGSDLPFCLSGLAAARVGGRGERIEAVALPAVWLLLAWPGLAVSTAAAYGWWASRPAEAGGIEAVAEALEQGRAWPEPLNALEAGVLRQVPEVGEVLGLLREQGARLLGAQPQGTQRRAAQAAMSGSGSTCFLRLDGPEQAAELRAALAALRPGWWTRLARAGV